MKKFKKILKWSGLVLLLLIVGISTITATRQHLKYQAAYPAIRAVTDSNVIAKGRHIVFDIAHCAHCHSTANVDSLLNLGLNVPLSGGYLFDFEVGKIYSKNITPDKVNGIGRYTDQEIARVLRYGVSPTGTAMFDFMPFHNMSDEDLTSVISYLRAQQPVPNVVPKNELNVVGKLVNAFMVKPVGPEGAVAVSIKPDSTAAYGKYLVNNMANCSGCHSPRDMSGAFIGEPLSGGGPMGGGFVPPNLTPDSSSRIFGWSQQDFIKRVRQGKLIKASEMPWNAYKRMSDDELKAIYQYLRSVKPAKTATVK